MKKLKSIISLDLIFIILEVIILFIMIFFQIKTIVTNHDAVKYASLYYPMIDISKIFLIALPTLLILSYFISYIHDEHQLIDKQNLLVIYLILGLLANIFSIALSFVHSSSISTFSKLILTLFFPLFAFFFS